MHDILARKEVKLLESIRQYERVAVAFSGGVDSSVVLAACKEAGVEVVPIFANTVAVPEFEKQDAWRVAKETASELVSIEHNPLAVPEFRNNDARRCYYCKKALLQALKKKAREFNCQVVFDGANLDDCGDYRPGMQAVKEEGIISPLLLAGLNKAEVRLLAEKYQLSVAAKPAYACLASRLPYGEIITEEKLKRVEQAEAVVQALGFKNCRVRCHGDLARLEVAPESIEQAVAIKESLVARLKAVGFLYVTLDLEGYRTGSLNAAINKADL